MLGRETAVTATVKAGFCWKTCEAASLAGVFQPIPLGNGSLWNRIKDSVHLLHHRFLVDASQHGAEVRRGLKIGDLLGDA